MLELSRDQARRLAVVAQGFRDPVHTPPTLRTFDRTLARTGVLQVDSVNVLQRAHYMPLFSRMGPYDTELLRRASERRPRRVVEYWAHVQAFMPVDLWPVMRHRMEEHRRARGKWGSDGVTDERTWRRLRAMTDRPTSDQLHNVFHPGPALLEAGDTGDAVRDLQARLVQIAWLFGDVTGTYDGATSDAVRGFQHKRGIPVTGDVDQRTLDRLHAMLDALPSLRDVAPEAVVAVEVRDPEWLTPDFVAVLKDTGARYCLGLHPKLPPIQDQLPLLRAMWPGPLVCRWNLHRVHGPFGYEDAEKKYGEYAEVMDPDPETRAVLAKVVRATAEAGQPCYVTISNHAEGSAPLSLRALAREIVDPA